MTATITEEGVDTDSTLLLDWKHVPPCEAEFSDGTTCENEAKFVCGVKCCFAKILLCEDCFFGFLKFSEKYEGARYECGFCNQRFTLTKDHLTILDRV